MRENRRLAWSAAWLAIVFVAVKANYLGAPAAATPRAVWDYGRDLAAISFIDVLLAAMLWGCGRAALALSGGRSRVRQAIGVAVIGLAAVSCLYALASVFFFGVFGGFLTYPLLALVGDVHMLRSSVEAQVSPVTLIALGGLPLLYLALVAGTLRFAPENRGPWWRPLPIP